MEIRFVSCEVGTEFLSKFTVTNTKTVSRLRVVMQKNVVMGSTEPWLSWRIQQQFARNPIPGQNYGHKQTFTGDGGSWIVECNFKWNQLMREIGFNAGFYVPCACVMYGGGFVLRDSAKDAKTPGRPSDDATAKSRAERRQRTYSRGACSPFNT